MFEGPPPSTKPRVPRLSGRLVGILPAALFAILLGLSWNRWFLPFQDSGRELATAWRVATGEVLYRDVAYIYGPVAPLLDAAVLRVTGIHAASLVALRTAIALAGLWAAGRLARRLCRGRAVAAAASALVVSACFFLPSGGAYPFPYSAAALEGQVGTWLALELALGSRGMSRSLAAGLLAGVAACTKQEMLPVALAGPLLALVFRRPRREAASAFAVALSVAGLGWGVPLLLFGRPLMISNGFLVAGSLPDSWASMYRSVFWAGGTSREFLGGGFLHVLGPSVLFLGLALALVAVRTGSGPRRLVLPGLVGLSSFLVPSSWELNALLPLAVLAVLAEALVAVRGGGFRARSALLAVGASMIPSVVRQPFTLAATSPYAAFSAPLALLVACAVLSRLVGRLRAAALAALLAGLALAQTADRALSWRLYAREEVTTARGSFLLVPEEARLLRSCVDAALATAGPGEWFAVLPEGGIVNFLADRRSPFAEEQVFPGRVDASGERAMVLALEKRPPRGILVVDRDYSEFGARGFGDGYLEGFREAMARGYLPGPRLGEADPSASGGRFRAASATLWLPRPPAP